MKHHSHLPRRCVVCALGLVLALPVLAHDGAHGPDVMADVVSAVASGDAVTVSVTLTGLGGPLRLIAVSAEGAATPPMPPADVRFAEDVPVDVTLRFARGVPDIFTLVFDFGMAGRGAVSVVPQQAVPD
ncbi:hypothetical protein [uncultured Tateyamaria sp.]|uniref:hypothetical protein n=1 Tax=uncultured Tateyamaria sp. TaxID=455651 RepID=UPI002605973C|nr:hypothetical protein [uncultured Tateyamaria sp.]